MFNSLTDMSCKLVCHKLASHWFHSINSILSSAKALTFQKIKSSTVEYTVTEWWSVLWPRYLYDGNFVYKPPFYETWPFSLNFSLTSHRATKFLWFRILINRLIVYSALEWLFKIKTCMLNRSFEAHGTVQLSTNQSSNISSFQSFVRDPFSFEFLVSEKRWTDRQQDAENEDEESEWKYN